MQGRVLSGVVLSTLWGQRTIDVTNVETVKLRAHSRTVYETTTEHVDFCFREEPSRVYSLEVFGGFLVERQDIDRVIAFLELWLRAGPPSGSSLKLTAQQVRGAQPQ